MFVLYLEPVSKRTFQVNFTLREECFQGFETASRYFAVYVSAFFVRCLMIQTKPIVKNVNHPNLESSYDVIVIGAGPAGCTAATLLAEQGHSILILDRGTFPRFHVGESMIPKTYDTLKRLGLLEKMKASSFPKKYSVQFVTDTGKVTAPFYFDEYIPHESSITWQVERGPFDEMMLENAKEKGATVRTDAQVRDVLFENDQTVGVRVKLSNGEGDSETVEIGARVVVDATGQSAFLANRMKGGKGLEKDPHLRKGAIWTYYENGLRDEGKDEGATLIMQTEGKKSWFWYIPLHNNTVSVGCTANMKFLFDKERGTHEDIFQQELERCPEMKRRLASATRVADHFVTKDFSYRATQTAGAGWCLIGDAFGFVDPVYSSGILLAFKSGEFAADTIHSALEENNFTAEKLGEWNAMYGAGIENFKKLVYAFYTPGFSFAKLLREHPQYRSNLIDILMGDVFKPKVDEIFSVMEGVVPPVED